MPFENFYQVEADGSRRMSGPRVRAFVLAHRDRCHFRGDELDSPEMIVLDRPFKFRLIPNYDVYRLIPVQLADLIGWPPAWGGAYQGADRMPMPGAGVIEGASVTRPARREDPPYLSISGSGGDNPVSAALGGYSEPFLRSIAATLNHLRGRAVRDIARVELVEEA